MNRKSFFRSFVPAGLAAVMARNVIAAPIDQPTKPFSQVRFPPYLKAGDTVAITCPAGPVDADRVLTCSKVLKRWGLNVVYGKTVGKRWQRFGGTDKERLEDFQSLLDDTSINAIIFGKGGYGTMRIIDELNWDKFYQHPKWLVGFSDLTVVHLHVHANMQIPTIHGHMGQGFSSDPNDASAFSLNQALFGNKMEYNIRSASINRKGLAKGKLIGGNLTLIHASAATKSDINTDGKILFIEDVSEYKYTIDRMMMSLKRSGKLDKLAGLLVGSFSAVKQDTEETFDMRIDEIIWDKVKEYKYPVCFNFPAGHIPDNRALKLGVGYEMNVGSDIVTLAETDHTFFDLNPSAKDLMKGESSMRNQELAMVSDTSVLRH
jgi:muramoyltetrapeptide carboxypeptidase